MDQAFLNSLLVILFLIVGTMGTGIMVWRRFMPSTRPVPAPPGAGTTPPTSTRLRDHVLFWPGVVAVVIAAATIGSAGYFYGLAGLLVISALAIAGYGGYRGGGQGAVYFTRIAGTLLIIAVIWLLIFGEKSGERLVDLRNWANAWWENGVWPDSTPPTAPSSLWSPPISVNAGEWSDPIWVDAEDCMHRQILEGSTGTPEWFRQHSQIKRWKEDVWRPNDGGHFRAIRFGNAASPFSFRYKLVPKGCTDS